MIDSWKYCQQAKRLYLYGWCIMTSHVHMIIGTHGDKPEHIVLDMKKYTSVALKAAIKNHLQESRRDWIIWMMEGRERQIVKLEFQLWQQDNHPIELFEHKILQQKLDYIHFNPVVAGIVEKSEDYLYSSARNYSDLPGLFDVILVSPVAL